MNFAKSDRVRLKRTKILGSKKGAIQTNKKQRKQHFANLNTEYAKCSLIASILNCSNKTQNKHLQWKNIIQLLVNKVKIISIKAFFGDTLEIRTADTISVFVLVNIPDVITEDAKCSLIGSADRGSIARQTELFDELRLIWSAYKELKS